jgi:hypothetical protein
MELFRGLLVAIPVGLVMWLLILFLLGVLS